MSRPRAVYVATHSWSSPIRVGSHHFACEIAKHFETLYIPHPVTALSLLNPMDNAIGSRLRNRSTPRQAAQHGLEQFTPWMLVGASDRPLFNCAAVAKHAHKLTYPGLGSRVEQLGFFAPDLMVLDTCFQSFWPALLKPRELIVRAADHPQGFSSNFCGGVERAWQQCLEQADWVFSPSMPVARYIGELGVEAAVVANGVDLAHFQNPMPAPAEYAPIDGPIALYVGAVADWVDTDLIFEVARHLPQVTFFLIGPQMRHLDNAVPGNVRLLGSIDYQRVPAFYQHADVALVPFDVVGHKQLIESVDAIKIYEYLAASLPVVTTSWPQTQRMSEFLYVSQQDPTHFAQQLMAALAGGRVSLPPQTLSRWSWQSRFQEIVNASNINAFADLSLR